ncbi:hypothetical protein Anapl_13891 [Anas platyrhynchos]|uniref:Uncharacterized protein n=1 Tax=Anas platyrhynchos TaxID=8839 RepID=R0L6U4_ANAPL|nr:hypothetical protein Anapl_13891 [Anas platyrhynchos]
MDFGIPESPGGTGTAAPCRVMVQRFVWSVAYTVFKALFVSCLLDFIHFYFNVNDKTPEASAFPQEDFRNKVEDYIKRYAR